MATESSEDRDLNPSACLADIRNLSVELRRAITALTVEDIAAVEASTQIQESLVNKIQEWMRGQAPDAASAVTVPASDFRTLVELTRVYSAFLQRALRTIRLRASLCQTYRQNFPAQTGRSSVSGWSCEI